MIDESSTTMYTTINRLIEMLSLLRLQPGASYGLQQVCVDSRRSNEVDDGEGEEHDGHEHEVIELWLNAGGHRSEQIVVGELETLRRFERRAFLDELLQCVQIDFGLVESGHNAIVLQEHDARYAEQRQTQIHALDVGRGREKESGLARGIINSQFQFWR